MLNIEYNKENASYKLVDTSIPNEREGRLLGDKFITIDESNNSKELESLKDKLLSDYEYRVELYSKIVFPNINKEIVYKTVDQIILTESEEIDKFSFEEINKRHPELFTMSETEMFKELKLASSVYYNTGASIMSDERYDAMEMVFKDRFPHNLEVYKVGAELNEKDSKLKGFNKVEHTRIPGVTQHKAKNMQELEEKLSNKSIEKQKFVYSEKLDGISLYSLYDENGDLTQVVSRGTGVIGDDITANAKNIKGLKNKIDISLYKQFEPNLKFVEIRGEGIILNKDFKELNSSLIKDGEKELKNQRNAASGIIRRLEGDSTKFISFMPYEEIIETKSGLVYQRDEILKMEMLETQGFKTPKWGEITDIENIGNLYNEYIEKRRQELRTKADGYEIDGLVFKANSNEVQEELGMTSGKQNGQIALKFPPETGITKLVEIRYSMGNTGVITPVAVVEPISVAGVTITNISLANESIMNALLLNKGDVIEISRRNDVIPKVERNVKFDKFYTQFHSYIHEVVIDKINDSLLELQGNKKVEIDSLIEKSLFNYKENLEFDISNNMLDYELEINSIIREGLYKDNVFLDDKCKTDKQILDNVVKYYNVKLKKETIKHFEKFSKELDKKVDSKAFIVECKKIVENLFENIKDVSKDLYNYVDSKSKELKELNEKNELFVSQCPICGSTLSSENKDIFCSNSDCDGVKQGKIVSFISKNEETMRVSTVIDENKDKKSQSGIGKGKIKQLYEAGLINTIKDIYLLKFEDFIIKTDEKDKNVFLENFGESSVINLLNDIDKLRKLKDTQFLSGLNIKHLSESRFLKLLQKYNYKEIINGNISRKELLEMPNFGEIIIDSMIKELEERKEEIAELLEIIEIVETEKPTISMDSIKTFVITGSVTFKPEDENSVKLKALIEESGYKYDRNGIKDFLTKKLGHNVTGSVTTKTDYLINDDIESTSEKNKKAQTLKIPIIKPETVYEIINSVPKVEQDLEIKESEKKTFKLDM